MKTKGIAAMLFVILVWGITFANTRALLFDFSALEIQVLRFVMAWAALRIVESVKWRVEGHGAAATRGDSRRSAPCRDEWLFAGMGLCGVFIYQFLENCAIYYTNASNVAILVSFGPVVTAAMARVFTKDRSLNGRFLLGSAAAICGVALVSLNGVVNFNLRPLGDLMALGAMVSWGCYSILVDRANARGHSQITVMRKSFFWAVVMMLPLVAWGMTESGFYALDGSFSVNLDVAANVERFGEPMNWVNLGFLGLLASALCFVLWNVACRSLGVVKATVGLYLTPVVGVIFAAAFLDERITAMSAAGGVLIVGGVVAANFRRAK